MRNGRLNVGIWQGAYLCEYRVQGSAPSIIATLKWPVSNQLESLRLFI
ncbi:YjbQ family protein [Shewanella sp. OMA3-2]|nr:YjbQ family protein [Shewanella sp. OMA3-2]UJF23504.1 YjbQ family protein [Shewanella sp. OMA3-2]